MKLGLSTYCTIRNGVARVNNQVVFEGATVETGFLKGLYLHCEMGYPKFFKMDNLSKLGVLGVELLRKEDKTLANYADDEIGLVFQSENGCLESDMQHQEKVNSQSPSPAVFVYTLSNIVIGEISIRNKWFGESVFFIDTCAEYGQGKETELSALISYSKSLILTGKSACCIIGVIESFNDVHSLTFGVIAPMVENGIEFTEENFKNIMSI